jgi:hypothetical protein
MAAPHVAGVASLMYSLNPSLLPAQVSSIMRSNVTAFPGGSTCDTTICGTGIVNAAAALAAVPGAVPATPVLSAISNSDGDGSFTVDWNAAVNADSYTLQEDDNSSFSSPATVYSGTDTQYDVTGKTGGNWYYRVRATNSDGNSAWSNTEYTTVKPDAPTLDAISNPGYTDTYTITWSTSTGADGYWLQEAISNTFTSPTTRYMGADTTYLVTGQAGGDWYYRVLAYNDAGNSPVSNTEFVSVTLSSLGASDVLVIDNADLDQSYTVEWNSVSGATSYILEESDNPYFVDPTVVYSGSQTNTTIANQNSGNWYYRARGISTTDQGPWGDAQSAEVGAYVYLPLVLKPDPGPTPGFWSGAYEEFYVTTDSGSVNRFAIYVSVSGCGNYKITHISPIPAIVSDQFSHSGPFYFSGTFHTTTTASGTEGLNNFELSGCGTVSGGPWSWTASWVNSSQPSILSAELVVPELIEPMPDFTKAYEVTKLDP